MIQQIENILTSKIPKELIKVLLDAYFEQKKNYYLGKFRPSELEAGRFTEATIRILEYLTSGNFTPLNKPLSPFDKILQRFENLPSSNNCESIRIYIPRALYAVYTIRNRRDVGHIGGDVNPNIADANYVMSVCDWVLAELIRLIYNCTLEEAQALVDGLVDRKIPLIEEFDGFLKILKPELSTKDKILLMLYYMGEKGLPTEKLFSYLKNLRRNNIYVALSKLENENAFIHRSANICFITKTGIKYTEEKISFLIQ